MRLRNKAFRMLLAVAAVALTGCATAPPLVTRPLALSAEQQAAVERDVKADLKDGESARFGPMAAAVSDKGSVFVCGTVNAKNSYGGYVGAHRYAGQLAEIRQSDKAVYVFSMYGLANDKLTSQIVDGECRRAGL